MLRKLFLVLALTATAHGQEVLNTLWPPRGRVDESFGSAVALDGSRLVVAALRSTSGPGVLFVYRREGKNWIEEARLSNRTQAEFDAFDGFGWTAAVSGDRVAASARFDAGTVYVFERQPDGSWTKTTIPAPDPVNEQGFGDEIDLDGDTLVATTFERGGTTSSAYVFQRVAGAWTQTARFQDVDVNDASLDGDTLAVSAGDWPPFTAMVRIYERSGTDWILSEELPQPFAAKVELDGDTLALSRGSAIFFRRSGDTWVEEGRVLVYHTRLALSGNRALIADEVGNQDFRGIIQVVERVGGVWTKVGTLDSLALEGREGSRLGESIAGDGSTWVLGAYEWNGTALRSGAAVTLSIDDRASLGASPQHLSLAKGGTLGLDLDAGPAHAGRTFVLAGSLGGTSPGFRLGRVFIPLQKNEPYFQAGLRAGTLDADGRARVEIAIPPLPFQPLVNRTLHHAFVVLAPPHGIAHVSNVALATLNR